MAAYRYTPLEDKKLRLLTLLPGESHDQIQALISHYTFGREKKPVYEALSYRWGSTDDPASLEIRDQADTSPSNDLNNRSINLPKWSSLPITRNLDMALRYLRQSTQTRTLWVDAICINQKDDQEKSGELPRMGAIYENAERVVIWLGVEAEESALAIRCMTMIAEDVDVDGSKSPLPVSYRRKLLNNATRALGEIKQAQASLLHEWVAIGHLLHRDWFTRLWVYQELHLSTSATVIVGFDTISWNEFLTAFRWVSSQIREHPEYAILVGIDRQFLRSIFEALVVPPTGTIMGLLVRTKGLQCFDPRDRFYAIWSLISPVGKCPRPDYSQTIESVYSSWTSAAILASGLDTLALSPAQESTSPSWSLDPSYPGLPNPIQYYRNCRASELSWSGKLNVKVSALDNRWESLLLLGKFVDEIEQVAPVCPLNATREELLDFCRTWNELHVCLGDYVGGGTSKEAFACALVCNMFISNRVATPDELSPSEFCVLALRNIIDRAEDYDDDLYIAGLQDFIAGRCFFYTKKGYMGLCPPTARPGDRIFVATGNSTPFVVRRVLERYRCYRLAGGESYVHGMMNCEAFLGPLPSGWDYQWRTIGGKRRPYYISGGNTNQQEDPRLGPLPKKWKIIYEDETDVKIWYKEKFDSNGRVQGRMFYNTETQERQHTDPRLTLDAIKDTGFKFDEINLEDPINVLYHVKSHARLGYAVVLSAKVSSSTSAPHLALHDVGDGDVLPPNEPRFVSLLTQADPSEELRFDI